MSYKIYCWKIRLKSSYLTPWQSDTIYGHIFWAISMLYGENKLKEILQEFRNGNAPFIISDGILEDSLPYFRKSNIRRDFTNECCKLFNLKKLECIQKLKELNKISQISLEEFNYLRGSISQEDFLTNVLWNKKRENSVFYVGESYHNVINRLSGGTGENSIFTQKEFFSTKNIQIFIKLREDQDVTEFSKYLDWIEKNGYGKKISSGKGQIERVSFEEFFGFKKIEDANAFVSLSNYIPKIGDYEKEVCVEVITKMPKLASGYTAHKNPFKKTFSCFAKGSIFLGEAKENMGRVLELHYDSQIIHVGIPFVVEVKI